MLNETKLCKHCKNEIPKKENICPNCKKKQGGATKWIVIAVAFLIIIGIATGRNDDNGPNKVGDINVSSGQNKNTNDVKQNEKEPSVLDEPDGEKVFKKGEIAELNNVQVTLTDYKESSGSEYNKPADGNVFLLAEFEIANNADKDLVISSMLSFEAYADDYKLDYSLGAMMDKDGSQLDGSIAAGKKMKGWIGWEVPQDYKNVEVHFTDNVWSNDKFVFLIEK